MCPIDVLVALSGGLDSAAVVLLLREAGYRPRALFLDMLDSPAERERAMATAEALEVELHIEPVADLFRKEIIDYVLSEHAAGRTPAPCSRCNPRVKWRILASVADRLGIWHIATGHYVRVVTSVFGGEGHSYFRRGIDPAKDQSYYLWDVPEELVKRAVMPLGDYTKAEVRLILQERYGLAEVAGRRESMGVCFLGGRKYADFLRDSLPEGVVRPGSVEDASGRVVGVHEGVPLYTAGQKRGFSLFPCVSNLSVPLAVVGADPQRNVLLVDEDEALYSRVLFLRDWRAVSGIELLSPLVWPELRVMVRGIGRNPIGGSMLTVLPDGRIRLELSDDRAWALAPGQPIVFYLNDRVVGGGILDEIA